MAEVNTTQGAKVLTRQKLLPNESFGRQRILASKMPATYGALSVNDTIFLGRIPAGSRLLASSFVSNATGTASGTMNIGLRETVTGTVLSATGIASGLDIATAGVKLANNGAYIAAGAEYVTAKEVDVYATVTGAGVAANTSIKFEIAYVND